MLTGNLRPGFSFFWRHLDRILVITGRRKDLLHEINTMGKRVTSLGAKVGVVCRAVSDQVSTRLEQSTP